MIRMNRDGTVIPAESFEDMAARYREAAAAFQQDMAALIESGYFRRPPPKPMPYVPLFRRGLDDPNYYDNAATIEAGE